MARKYNSPKGVPTPEPILTQRQHMFAVEYAQTRDGYKAAIIAGATKEKAYHYAQEFLTLPEYKHVRDTIDRLTREIEERAVERGIDIREYVYDVLTVNLLRWFVPTKDGGWEIGIDRLQQLPDNVGRLIEKVKYVERELPDGTTARMCEVTLVSKTAAMALGVKLVLDAEDSFGVGRKGHFGVTTDNLQPLVIDWEELQQKSDMKRKESAAEKEIKRILALPNPQPQPSIEPTKPLAGKTQTGEIQTHKLSNGFKEVVNGK